MDNSLLLAENINMECSVHAQEVKAKQAGLCCLINCDSEYPEAIPEEIIEGIEFRSVTVTAHKRNVGQRFVGGCC